MPLRRIALTLAAALVSTAAVTATSTPSYADVHPNSPRYAVKRLVAAGNADRVTAMERLASPMVVTQLRREVRHGMRLELGDCFRAPGAATAIGGEKRGCTVQASGERTLSIYEVGLRRTPAGRWKASSIHLIGQS